MKKKIVSILLSLTVVMGLLTGCGGNAQENSAPAAEAEGNDASAESGENAENTENAEGMPNLVISFAWSAIPADIDMIEEEINKITMEEIGCTVTLNGYTYGNLADQQTLILSSPDEQWDVMLGQFRSGITSYVSKGQLTPLNDLLDQYGQDIKEVLGDYIGACSVDGECYEITTCRNLANQEACVFDKALIVELGLEEEIAAVKTYADLTPIFEKIHEAYPERYVTASSATKPNLLIASISGADALGDNLGALLDAGDPTVSNLFESEEYKELCKLTKSWNEAGYIYPDITTDDSNSGQTLMANDLCASYFTSYKPGLLVEHASVAQRELVAATCDDPLAVTLTPQIWGWAIPTNAKYPEQAMQFINLLFTDEDLINLFSFGVEGYHWTLNEDGFATDGEHTEGYPDKGTWKSGNAYIGKVWVGDDADLYDQLRSFNENAEKSVALGFSFNNEAYTAEYTAMQSVISQYRMLLEWGFVSDVDASLAEFNQALYDAGLQEYMDAKQEQLNAYLGK